jgi:hypothetical protein
MQKIKNKDNMSDYSHIESFNIEQPLNIYPSRGTGFSEDSEVPQEDITSNDNIIFQKENSSLEMASKKSESGYLCIKGDSEFSCILNLVVSAIGGGCFSFPFIMYEGGIIVSFIAFVFVTFSIYYSIDLMRSFVVDTKYYSFALITEKTLGPKWLKVYAFSSFTIYTDMEVGYLSSIYLYIKTMYGFTNGLSIILYFLISMIIEIVICLYITKIANMHLMSMISITCFTLMLLSLIIISIASNQSGQVEDKFIYENLFFPKLSPNTTINKILKFSSYLMIYVYGYSYHSTFPTIIGSLHSVNNTITKKVHLISFGIICVAYFLISIFGFILSNEVPTEIFQEDDKYFVGGWATLRKPFKYSLIIFLLFLIPIRFIVVRDNYIILIGQQRITFFKELTIVVIFIFICNILVFCVAEFETYMNHLQIKNLMQAFGGFFGVIIAFCLPVVNYVSINGKKKIKSIIGYIILGIYLIAGILCGGNTFYQIFSGKPYDGEN